MNPSFPALSFSSSPPFHVILPFWCFVTISPHHFLWSVATLFALHFPYCWGSHSSGRGQVRLDQRMTTGVESWSLVPLEHGNPFLSCCEPVAHPGNYRKFKWCPLSLCFSLSPLSLCRFIQDGRVLTRPAEHQPVGNSDSAGPSAPQSHQQSAKWEHFEFLCVYLFALSCDYVFSVCLCLCL